MSSLTPTPNPIYRILIAAGLSLLLAAIYWPGLSGGFFFDDYVNIVEPAEIQINSISIESLRNLWESGRAGPLGRPVSLLSFAANYYFSGFNPFVFKLTNLAIHGLNGFLIYLLTGLFARAAYPSSNVQRIRVMAAIVATLWVIHPIQATSVLYVVQRMTSLASMFMLLALIFHVWARQRQKAGGIELSSFALAWGVFLPLAMLSKETGVVFLLYLAAYEAILHRNYLRRLDLFGAWYLTVLIAAGGVSMFYVFSPSGAWLLQGYDSRPFTLTQRLLTEARIVWTYIDLTVLPALPDFGLYHDDYALSTGVFAPYATFFAIAGLLLLGALGWIARIKWPLISFAIAWFLLGHVLESSIFPLELMHEHRNYLPSLGVLIIVIAVLQSSAMSVSAYRLIAYGGIFAFAAYCAMLGYLRADLYGDDFRRTQIESGYRMDSVRTQYEAGAVMVNMYNVKREPILAVLAGKHFERANSLDSNYKLALIGMLQLDCLSGRPARAAVLDELRGRLSGHEWIPYDRTVMHGLSEMSNAGTICLARNQMDELFGAAISNKSTSAQDRSVIYSEYAAYLWLGQKDYAAARDALVRATKENASDTLNRLNLLQLYRLTGDGDGVMHMLNDLENRKLSRRNQHLFESIKTELTTEGVLVN
ncbi:MAG: pilus assembly protein PilF [Burkholderiales bacterium]|nr:pilus assembly protein PilF [Burkholderiales bacterium]